ncbi:ankyrin, partial [Acetobacter malorum]
MTQVSSQDPRSQGTQTPGAGPGLFGDFTQEQVEALFINAAREGEAD